MSKIHTILGDWPAPEYAWQAEFMPPKCRGLFAVRCYMHCCAALQHRGHNPGLSPRRNTTRAGPSSRQRKQNGHANYYLGATQAPPARAARVVLTEVEYRLSCPHWRHSNRLRGPTETMWLVKSLAKGSLFCVARV